MTERIRVEPVDRLVQDAKLNAAWEFIGKGTYRLRVEGGWLFQAQGKDGGIALAVLHDPPQHFDIAEAIGS